jgi:hypothetical protein
VGDTCSEPKSTVHPLRTTFEAVQSTHVDDNLKGTRHMSILDDIKATISGLLEGNGDKVSESLDKARGLADEATGGSLGEQVEGGVQQAKDGVQKAKDALSGS